MSESIERVVRELKKPVASSPGFDQRVMARVLASGARRRPRVWWPYPALAAAAALIVMVSLPRGRAVPFTLVAPQAASVAIVGDFNDWKPTPLVKNGVGAWETRMRLAPGQYNYAFVVDGSRWVADPAAPKNAVDDFGSPNSVVTVAL